MRAIRVGIVDDQYVLAHDLAEKLSLSEELQTTFIAEDAVRMMAILSTKPEAHPDVLFMDIEMPPMNGIEATWKVKNAYPGIKVVMLTVFDQEEKVFEALKAGASGYLLKDEKPTRLVQAIFEAVAGGLPFSPGVAHRVLEYLRAKPANGHNAVPLAEGTVPISKREREVLECLKEGSSIRQIAGKLFISERTVQKHLENIYHKLHVKNSREALSKFYDGGR
jgi:DNA-binding NarL/FixJ family response regulator